MIALHQRVQGAFAHVFVVVAAKQIEQHTFAQGAVAVVHAVQFKGIEDRFENRQARREDSAAVWLDAVEVDLVDLAQLEQLAFDPGQAFGVDLAIAQATGLDGSADGANGAG
ncbi:hypothetical protein D9M71_560890 [compost metagenome]